MSDELAISLQYSVNKKFGNGTYRVLQPIKRGADGYVYKIQFLKHKKLGALKVLPKSLLSIQPDATEELKKKYKHDTNLQRKAKNEIKIHSALNSGFVVKLQNWSKDDMNYYLVLQYLSKGDLGDEIYKNPHGLSIDRIRKIGLQIAKGIDTIHKKQIVHRDIKPQNILLTQEDEIKICDFSCASQLKISKNQKLQGAIGTLEYMAPQILKKYDNSVDIWSYGCSLYAMATGKVPFKLQKNQLKDYMRKVNFKNARELRRKMLQNLLASNKNRQELLLKSKTNKKSECECLNTRHEQCYKKLANLLKKILVIDVNRRINMRDILSHPFFTCEPLIEQSQNQQQLQQNDINTIQNTQQQSTKPQQNKTRYGIAGSIKNYNRTNTQQNSNPNSNQNHIQSVHQNQLNNPSITVTRPKTSYSLQNMKKYENKYNDKQQYTIDKNNKKLTKTQTVLQKHKQKYGDYSQNSRIIGNKYTNNNANANEKASKYQGQKYENKKKDKQKQPIRIKQQYQRTTATGTATGNIYHKNRSNDQNINTMNTVNTNNKQNDNKNKIQREHQYERQKYAHIDQLMKYKLNDKYQHQYAQQTTQINPPSKTNKYISDGTHIQTHPNTNTPAFNNSTITSQKQSSPHIQNPQPLNCQGLNYTIKFSQSEQVIINEHGLKGQFNHSQKSMLISPKGTHIKIMYQNKSKQYELKRLPEKYMRLYHEYKGIVDDLKQSKKKGGNKNSRYEENGQEQGQLRNGRQEWTRNCRTSRDKKDKKDNRQIRKSDDYKQININSKQQKQHKQRPNSQHKQSKNPINNNNNNSKNSLLKPNKISIDIHLQLSIPILSSISQKNRNKSSKIHRNTQFILHITKYINSQNNIQLQLHNITSKLSLVQSLHQQQLQQKYNNKYIIQNSKQLKQQYLTDILTQMIYKQCQNSKYQDYQIFRQMLCLNNQLSQYINSIKLYYYWLTTVPNTTMTMTMMGANNDRNINRYQNINTDVNMKNNNYCINKNNNNNQIYRYSNNVGMSMGKKLQSKQQQQYVDHHRKQHRHYDHRLLLENQNRRMR